MQHKEATSGRGVSVSGQGKEEERLANTLQQESQKRREDSLHGRREASTASAAAAAARVSPVSVSSLCTILDDLESDGGGGRKREIAEEATVSRKERFSTAEKTTGNDQEGQLGSGGRGGRGEEGKGKETSDSISSSSLVTKETDPASLTSPFAAENASSEDEMASDEDGGPQESTPRKTQFISRSRSARTDLLYYNPTTPHSGGNEQVATLTYSAQDCQIFEEENGHFCGGPEVSPHHQQHRHGLNPSDPLQVANPLRDFGGLLLPEEETSLPPPKSDHPVQSRSYPFPAAVPTAARGAAAAAEDSTNALCKQLESESVSSSRRPQQEERDMEFASVIQQQDVCFSQQQQQFVLNCEQHPNFASFLPQQQQPPVMFQLPVPEQQPFILAQPQTVQASSGVSPGQCSVDSGYSGNTNNFYGNVIGNFSPMSCSDAASPAGPPPSVDQGYVEWQQPTPQQEEVQEQEEQPQNYDLSAIMDQVLDSIEGADLVHEEVEGRLCHGCGSFSGVDGGQGGHCRGCGEAIEVDEEESGG